MKRRFSEKLSFKIFLPIGLISLIMLAVSIAISSYLLFEMESIFSKNISFAVKSNTEKVSSAFARIDVAKRVISDGNERFFYGLTKYEGDLLTDINSYNEYKQQITTTLQNLLDEDTPYYVAILFADDSLEISKLLQSSSNDTYIKQTGTYSNQFLMFRSDGIKNTSWYKKMSENNLDEYWFCGDDNRIYLAKNIGYYESFSFIAENYIHIGTLLFSFDAAYLLNESNLSEFSGDTDIILYSGDSVIYSSTGQYSNIPVENFINSKSDNVHADILSNGMRLVTVIPQRHTAQIPVIRIIFTLLLILICFSLSVAVFTYISRNVATPISELSAHVAKKTLTPIEYDKKADNEIYVLYESFNSMTENIRSLIDKLYASGLEQQRSYLKMLQAQINPHFVYNILDNICCLSLLRGNGDIATILSNLSELMRYNIKAPDSLVPISDELHIIDIFYKIQKFRYHDKINFETDFGEESDLSDMKIPKLIIQPLVENSFYHGMRLCDSPLFVKLTIRRSNNVLIIRVEDNIPNVDTQRINDHLMNKITISSSSGGFGIRNVNERIQLTYSTEYGLAYEPSSLGGVAAVVHIPIDMPAASDIYLTHTKKYYEQLRGDTKEQS